MHSLVVSCLVVAYLAANIYAFLTMRVFDLARSGKHLLLYGVRIHKVIRHGFRIRIRGEKRIEISGRRGISLRTEQNERRNACHGDRQQS